MKYFPDEPAGAAWARYAVAVLPLVYLIVALLYSANSAPWGRMADPESAYAMNGLAWAAGYPMMKDDHPGTTTILLIGMVIKLWAFLSGRPDTIEFGLKNCDHLCRARGRSLDPVRRIAGRRCHGQECNAELSCCDAVSDSPLRQLRGPAFRGHADSGKPDGVMRDFWNGARAQGGT